jgi:S-adenosyl-L-methionine hydrolase (adenosine-forming)
MDNPLITLTTDFGDASPYVAAMKGVILAIHPQARLVDLTHRIPPQHLRHTAFFLLHSIPFFPRGVIHVVVVDPGVGSDRALLYVEVDGHRLVVPDNGCWTPVATQLARPPFVRRLVEAQYWRVSVSATFHGRDILAPVAAWLASGLDPEALGPLVTTWVELHWPAPVQRPDGVSGEVVFVDSFGNLITNISREALAGLEGRPLRVEIGGVAVTGVAQTYTDAPPGTLLALLSSAGMLEVAVNQGVAAERLHLGVGASVVVTACSS